MQTEQNNEEENLSKYYHLETEDEKQEFRNQRETYFGEVSSLLPRVTAAKSKLNEIQVALRAKVQQLEAELKKRAKENTEKAKQKIVFSEKEGNKKEAGEEDLLLQDLEFCKLGLVEGAQIGTKMDKDRSTLENILATREKKSYHVITDIALNPLPSDRAKDKNRDNENNGKQDDQSNDINADKQASASDNKDSPRKLSVSDLKKLRNGQSLDSIETPKSTDKTHAPTQNVNMSMMLRQKGGASLI